MAARGLSAAAAEGVDHTAVGIAPVADAAPHLAAPTSSAARKNATTQEPGSAVAVAPAPAAQPALQPAGHELIPHLSPVGTPAPGAADAASGVSIGGIAADAGALQADLGVTAAPASLPVREAAPTLRSDPAPPVAVQVAPAMISLATRKNGSNEIHISLHPLDLGHVQIHLVRGEDGSTSVVVSADRPETLQELAQNAHHLHAALDAANVPTDGRTLDFVSASATILEQSRNDVSSQTSTPAQDLRNGGSGEGRSSQDRARFRDLQQASGSGGTGGGSLSGAAAPASSRRQWQFNGLNITA